MKILFHICCGPCATASIKKLQEDDYEVVGYYYNPNIHPNYEYKKRLKEARRLARRLDIKLIVDEYEPSDYFNSIKGVELDQRKRCPKCWELRLAKTAQKAKELGVNIIGSTLRISPYQNQDELLRIGRDVAKKYNLSFYEKDLANCFNESVSMSKEQGMYRQKYCGCIFSKEYR